jgi:hypothetical protein
LSSVSARCTSLLQRRFIQTFEHIHPRPREQGVVQLERGVFRGGTDKNQGAVFDVGQERILLRLVEAMHFVDKQDGAAAILARPVAWRLPRPGESP